MVELRRSLKVRNWPKADAMIVREYLGITHSLVWLVSLRSGFWL